MVTQIDQDAAPVVPPANWSLRALAVAALILLGVAVGWAVVNAQRAAMARNDAAAWELHTIRVMMGAQQVLSGLQDGEIGQRGYLLTGDPRYLEPYLRAQVAVPRDLAALDRMTRDNPLQAANLDSLEMLANERFAQLEDRVRLFQDGHRDLALAKLREGSGLRTMTQIRATVDTIKGEEQRLLVKRERDVARATAASDRARTVLSVVGIGALVAFAFAAFGLINARDGRIAARAQGASLARIRDARDLLQSVIDGSGDPIFVKDRDGRLQLANQRFAELAGTSVPALIGADGSGLAAADADDAALYATGAPQTREATFMVEGTLRTFLLARVPWRRAGEVAGMIGVARDVTELKRAEDALRLTNRDLEARVAQRTAELSRALDELRAEVEQRTAAEGQIRQLQKMESIGQLTGGIAHDFNNMLAIIMGSLEMARRRLGDAADPQVTRLIDNAGSGAARAAALTARLLAFARQQPLAPEVIDANKMVTNMSELLHRTLGEHIRIETILAAGLWRTHADPAQLENALLNLAINARDAMPEGGKLTIETANSDLDDSYAAMHAEVAPGQYVAICVTDTGGGMPPEVVERAFDPFFTTKPPGAGTGLGLSQVFGYVRQSGGHVKIYSELGVGTTVKLYLPRHTGGEALPVPPERSGLVRGAGERILVVEDDLRVRGIAVEALLELGYDVVPADDPHHALELVASDSAIALLFTDVVMPEMTGRQLADAALRLRPDLKVLFTTGYTRNAIIHNGMVDHGVEFLQKPYTFEALARKVRAVLDRVPAARAARG